MLKQLPNALTLLRLILAPVIAWLWWNAALNSGLFDLAGAPQQNARFLDQRTDDFAFHSVLAAVLFIVAALTDLFDGMAARAFNAHSRFGRIIDPIADKALVGLPLIAIVLGMWDGKSGMPFYLVPVIAVAVAIIVLRDVLMTVIRLSAPDGEGAPVSSLAKMKTALELLVVGAFLVVAAIGPHAWLLVADESFDSYVAWTNFTEILEMVWVALLLLAAALSAWTGYQYLAPKRPA